MADSYVPGYGLPTGSLPPLTPGFVSNKNVLNQQPNPLKAAPAPVTPAPQGNPQPPSAYEQALQTLQNTPSPTLEQAQYQKPKAAGEIVGGLLNVLFPGSKIATMATGFMQGQQENAEQKYERTQQADNAKYQAAMDARNAKVQDADIAAKIQQAHDNEQEKAANDAVRAQEKAVTDAQIALYHQQMATIAQQNAQTRARTEAHRYAYQMGLLNQGQQRLTQGLDKLGLEKQRLGIAEQNVQREIRRDNMQNAAALSSQKIRLDTANAKMGLTANIALFRELAQDRRFNTDAGLKKLAIETGSMKQQFAQQFSAAVKNGASQDDLDALVANQRKQFDAKVAGAVAAHPEFSAAFDHTDGVVSNLNQEGAQDESKLNSDMEALDSGQTAASGPATGQSTQGGNSAPIIIDRGGGNNGVTMDQVMQIMAAYAQHGGTQGATPDQVKQAIAQVVSSYQQGQKADPAEHGGSPGGVELPKEMNFDQELPLIQSGAVDRKTAIAALDQVRGKFHLTPQQYEYARQRINDVAPAQTEQFNADPNALPFGTVPTSRPHRVAPTPGIDIGKALGGGIGGRYHPQPLSPQIAAQVAQTAQPAPQRSQRGPAPGGGANPLKSLVDYVNSPPPPGTYAQPPAAPQAVGAGLSPQAQVLQQQKMTQALPQAKSLVLANTPQQKVLRMLEGRGFTPENAQALYRAALGTP